MIYCDNHLLVLVKPPGIATQPDFHEQAKAYIKERFQKPGKVFLEPIHRLDKPVSGLVIFARTSKALSRLNEMQRQRSIKKFYRAKVEGKPPEEGTLRHYLTHGNFRAHVDPNGKEAILHFKRVGSNEVEIELITGRYHQIRAQFAAEGFPIVGDAKYGSKTRSDSLALVHYCIELEHPVTKEPLIFEALPANSLSRIVVI